VLVSDDRDLGSHGRLPDFIVIGAQKCGTTSLWRYLSAHPKVFTPYYKETNFFIDEGNWYRGSSWYESVFAGCGVDQLAGEASPGYTMFPIFAHAAERIWRLVPHVKLIYVIREPVERMISGWLHSRAEMMEFRDINTALLADLRYVVPSQYATQLNEYLKWFDRSSILVVRADDLLHKTPEAMDEICSFIGISSMLLGSLEERYNTSEAKRIPDRLDSPRHGLLDRVRSSRQGRGRSGDQIVWREAEPADLTLDGSVRSRLQDYLHLEFQELRKIVGPDMDLWGYA
jgi:hypothetical protein